jgi:16S rRNA processing protein RimM
MTAGNPGPLQDADEPVAVGIVRKPHGIRGQCTVSAFGETLSMLSAPVRIFLGRDAQSARQITVTELRGNPKGFICTFEGYDDMTSAEALRDQILFCARAELPELDNGLHYSFELVGMTVAAFEDGTAIGTVTEVENYTTVDCLEVRRDNGETIIIAMTPGVVKSVDKDSGTISVSRSAIEELLA